MERWDLYDEAGLRTGETWERARAGEIPRGRYHVVCDVLVRRRDGDFLLTRRDPGKEMYPGCWEASAGGSALCGETPEEAARRETLEETGLRVEELTLISVTRRPETKSFLYAYLGWVSCDPSEVRLQEGETVDYRWMDPGSFLLFVRQEPVLMIQYERYRPYLEQLRESLEKEG